MLSDAQLGALTGSYAVRTADAMHMGGTYMLCSRAYLRKRKIPLAVRHIHMRVLMMSLWKWYEMHH